MGIRRVLGLGCGEGRKERWDGERDGE